MGEPLRQTGEAGGRGAGFRVLGRRETVLPWPAHHTGFPGAYLAWRAPWWELEAVVVVMVGLGAAGLRAERSSPMRGLLGHPLPPGWCGLRGFPGDR